MANGARLKVIERQDQGQTSAYGRDYRMTMAVVAIWSLQATLTSPLPGVVLDPIPHDDAIRP